MYWLPVILILPYFFLLLRIYRDLVSIRPYRSKSVPSVFISVIIACRNEEASLPALLDSIAGQDYPKELFEVIIIDDNSDDKTCEAAIKNKDSLRLSVIKNSGAGKKEAIRTGIDAATGRLIITTDADCTMGTGWIKTIASFYYENKPDLIICPVQVKAGRNVSGIFQKMEYLGLQGITAGTATAGNAIMCNGGNLAFTREAYLRHTHNLHFELPTGDDVLLLHGIKKEHGSKILWLESSDAIVTTAASPSPGSFLRQRQRWISKWRFYDDRYTNLSGIITFSAVLLQLSVMIALLADLSFVWLLGAIIILKSVPDYLVIKNTAARYGMKIPMLWLLPAELIYPVYVFVVFLATLIPRPVRKV
jgi:cellulose synthase/poly-beta-1,6-N-acetylglucosamine synthase-like glycosyltransferase